MQSVHPSPEAVRCQSAFNTDPRLEWAPGAGQFQAAVLTGLRD